jgi:drug/metabolite transporter (DMT)-like permease
MTWAVLAGGSAVFYALHGGWSTRISRKGGAVFAGWALFTFALPVLGAYLALRGVPTVAPRFWPVWGSNAVMNLGALYLFFSALRSGDLGITYPLLALTPLFVIPIEYVMLGELPGPWGLVGVLLIVLGVYLLNFQGVGAGLGAPFRALSRNRGALQMLAVAVLWSLGGTLDPVAVVASSPAFYAFMFSVALSGLFLVVLLLGRKRSAPVQGGALGSPPGPSGPHLVGLRAHVAGFRAWELALHGSLWATMVTFQMEALLLAQVSYVLAIKRTGTLLAVLLGYVAFREGSLAPRLFGALITLAGATVLVVWG